MERGRRLGLIGLGLVLIISSVVIVLTVWRATNGSTVGAGLPNTGSGSDSAATAGTASTPADPNSVHTKWVAALQYNDRAAALALSAPQDQQAGVVDADLQMMRRYVPDTADTGGLKMVQAMEVTANGNERVGTSIWTFVKSKACFQATLTQQDDGNWKVRQWERIPCQP